MFGSLLGECLFELGEREGVDDVGLGEPSLAGDPGTEAEETGVLEAMSVAIDHAFDAPALGIGPEAPIQIEAVRAGVEFDPGAGFGTGINDGVGVEFIGMPFEEESAGEVTEHVHEGVFRGPDQAPGDFGFGLGETLMDAGDDDVELCEQVIVEIEPTFVEDVHFRAG